ncbi:MAG: serine/threonine protein kinase [Candidatus Didemnitutus sp.]|nr:serine/threonine protein kinase [Candidatus Didemnitutus sp.]
MRCVLCGGEFSTASADEVCAACALTRALSPTTEEPRDALAGYERLRELGRGAMGVVWLARERALDRLVALKVISLSGDPLAAERLLREGKVAASLQHPHIVAVHALGGEGATTFLAMDFVAGGNLAEKLARQPLAPRAAAMLVVQLADAVAHAHAAGVLHRDLKPSNVLLTPTGEPKLADFGLAGPSQGRGDLTRTLQVAGTPAFLAPELLSDAAATPLADVYGLGALLYVCLTGRAPFVAESTAAVLHLVATAEPVSPRVLQPGAPRDLETICLKCLSKRPAERYAGAAELRDDLRRFLRGETIAARPLGPLARGARWCRRRPAVAISAGLAATLLLTLAIGGPLVAVRIERERHAASEAAATARAVSEFLQNDLLAQASPARQPDRDLKLRTVLDRAGRAIEGRFAAEPEIEAALRTTLGETYSSLGDFETARRELLRARRLRAAAPAGAPEAVLALDAKLVPVLVGLGRYPEAAALARVTWERQSRVLGPEAPATLNTWSLYGDALRNAGRWPEAKETLRQALETRRRLGRPLDREALLTMNNYASALTETGELAAAERLFKESLELHRRHLGEDFPETLRVMNDLTIVLSREGKLTEAEALGQQALAADVRVLGPEHPGVLLILNSLASIARDRGRLDEAAAYLGRVLEIRRRVFGEKHSDTLVVLTNLAIILRDQGRLDEAAASARELVATREEVSGPEHPFTLSAMFALASIEKRQGEHAAAELRFRRLTAARARVLGESHPDTLWARAEWGDVLLLAGRSSEAEAELRRALALAERTEWDEWRRAIVRSRLGGALCAQGRWAEAEALLAAGVEGLAANEGKMPKFLLPELPLARERLARWQAAAKK